MGAYLLRKCMPPIQQRTCIVMEYLPGGEVQWTDEHHQPVLTVFQTRRIIRDVLVGLEYCKWISEILSPNSTPTFVVHHHGIIHRDIKPANLLWTQDRSCIKIADFGVSHFNPITRDHKRLRRRAQDFQNDSNLFPESDLLKRAGTPSFLAPEVVWFCDYGVEPLFSTASSSNSSETDKVTFNQLPTRRPSITKAIDVWSLAITFYCLLFGHTPFNTSDANDNIHHTEYMLYHLICTQDWTVDQVMGADRVLTGGRRPKDRESGGYVVIRLLDQMLQKNPDNRPTVGELKVRRSLNIWLFAEGRFHFQSHSWFLRDMANSEEWLRDTSPTVGSTPCRGWIERIGRKLLPRSMRTP